MVDKTENYLLVTKVTKYLLWLCQKTKKQDKSLNQAQNLAKTGLGA
jgi:hypothetical protein